MLYIFNLSRFLVLDSYGKFSGGVLYGHLNMVGSYDECLDVRAHIPAGTILGNRKKEKSRSFKTRYCRVSGYIPKHLVKIVSIIRFKNSQFYYLL